MNKSNFFWCFIPAILFISFPCFGQYQELYIPNIPKEITITLDGKNYSKYIKNIENIADSKIENIEKIHKQYFPIKLSFDGASRVSDCNAHARINGDWKDHISKDRKISSLTIKTKDCYLGGISRFRLLLPETKGGSNEIFWSMLMEEYGFPALYSQVVDVRINNRPYQALLQEVPTTAFLERHGIREAPIVEADEQQIWHGRANWFYHAHELNAPRHADPSSPFKFWLDDDSFVYFEFGDFGSLDYKGFAVGELKSQIAMRALSQYIAEANVVNSVFFNQLQSVWAEHGLGANRKLIYLPMINSFIPLYYDGNVNLNPAVEKFPVDFDRSCIAPSSFPNKNFSQEFKRRSRENLSRQMKCAYWQIEKNFSHLNDWSTKTLNFNIDSRRAPVIYKNPDIKRERLRSGYKDIYMNMLVMREGQYLLCKTSNKSQICNPIDFKGAHKILTNGDVKKIGNHKFLSSVVAGELDPTIVSKGIDIDSTGQYDIGVNEGEKYYLHVRRGDARVINIDLKGVGARVIIYGKLGEADVVSVSGHAPNAFPDSRHDELMLTGCVTFLDTEFTNPTISSTVTGCEDAINILHSKGAIKSISVVNATQDALDIDFSNLNIGDVYVEAAGNDCLDISTGNYEIGAANLKSCGDKAVSAGEYAQVRLGKVAVDGATLGLVAKDGALLSANQFEGLNIKDRCIDTYIKKKRFPIGHAHALSSQCTISSSKASAHRN